MLKRGFTLAEVLITLMIIGVVAALTTPALIQDVGNAKIGPTLAKVCATIENAHEMIMQEESISTLSSIASADLSLWNDDDSNNEKFKENYRNTMEKYMDALTTYIAGSSWSKSKSSDFATEGLMAYDGSGSAPFDSDGNFSNIFHFSDTVDIAFLAHKKQGEFARGAYKGRFAECVIDINGFKTRPNTIGKDVFFFDIDNNGKMIAHGGQVYAFVRNTDNTWDKSQGTRECSKNRVAGEGYGCAGSIMENNLKVIYR